MPLNYSLISSKSQIEYSNKTNNYSEKVIDLLSKTYRDDIDFSDMYSLIEITKEYNTRPDLVSLAIYKTDEYADILCKINGISNPFELNEGMILICPSEGVIDKFASLQPSDLDGIAEDKNTLIEKYNTFKKNRSEKRSPNEATVFDHTYTIIPNTNLMIY